MWGKGEDCYPVEMIAYLQYPRTPLAEIISAARLGTRVCGRFADLQRYCIFAGLPVIPYRTILRHNVV